MNLKGKTILVTGASSGIGQAIAIAVAQKGATAVIAYRKNKEGAEHTLKEVERSASSTSEVDSEVWAGAGSPI
jgi:glucose 1-dehydrogenase